MNAENSSLILDIYKNPTFLACFFQLLFIKTFSADPDIHIIINQRAETINIETVI